MKVRFFASAATVALVVGAVAASAQMSSPTGKEPVPGASTAPSEGQAGTSSRSGAGARDDLQQHKGRNAQRDGAGRPGAGEERGSAGQRPGTGTDRAGGTPRDDQRQGASENTGRDSGGTGATTKQSNEQRSGTGDDRNRRQQSQGQGGQRGQGRAGRQTEQSGQPQGTQDQRGKSQQTETPAAQGSQRQDSAQTPRQDGTGTATDRKRQDTTQSGERTGTQSGERTGAAAPGSQPGGGTATSETRTTTTANLPQEKQQRVVDVLSRHRDAEVRDVNISVSIGTSLPPRVRPRPLPREVITIVPEYRNYNYVVVRDEIVIVEPRTRRVVHVIPRSQAGRATVSTPSGGTTSSTSLRLAPEKRKVIREMVMRDRDRLVRAPSDTRIEIGGTVPDTIELRDLPDTIVMEVPEIRSYEYFVRGDEVVLIDRRERRIVDVIE
jgi:hypothetical protein